MASPSKEAFAFGTFSAASIAALFGREAPRNRRSLYSRFVTAFNFRRGLFVGRFSFLTFLRRRGLGFLLFRRRGLLGFCLLFLFCRSFCRFFRFCFRPLLLF